VADITLTTGERYQIPIGEPDPDLPPPGSIVSIADERRPSSSGERRVPLVVEISLGEADEKLIAELMRFALAQGGRHSLPANMLPPGGATTRASLRPLPWRYVAGAHGINVFVSDVPQLPLAPLPPGHGFVSPGAVLEGRGDGVAVVGPVDDMKRFERVGWVKLVD
jgi:hypothetical protein